MVFSVVYIGYDAIDSHKTFQMNAWNIYQSIAHLLLCGTPFALCVLRTRTIHQFNRFPINLLSTYRIDCGLIAKCIASPADQQNTITPNSRRDQVEKCSFHHLDHNSVCIFSIISWTKLFCIALKWFHHSNKIRTS